MAGMPIPFRDSRAFGLAADPLEAIEFELRLDLEEAQGRSFEECVRSAAEASGGSVLFEMPPAFPLGDDEEDFSRIAAVRFLGKTGERLVFAALTEDGETVRVLRRADVGERFYGFARAYLGILNRLRSGETPAGQA